MSRRDGQLCGCPEQSNEMKTKPCFGFTNMEVLQQGQLQQKPVWAGQRQKGKCQESTQEDGKHKPNVMAAYPFRQFFSHTVQLLDESLDETEGWV